MDWIIDHWVSILGYLNLIVACLNLYNLCRYDKLCKELDSAIEETREVKNIYKMALEIEKINHEYNG